MAKYDALRNLLRADGRPRVVLGFDELDGLLHGGLPASARRHRAWWANSYDDRHRQAIGWLDPGYEVEEVVLPDGPVTFRSTNPSRW